METAHSSSPTSLEDIDFGQQISPKSKRLYLQILRISAFIGQSSILILCLMVDEPTSLIPAFYTNWGIFITWIYLLVSLISMYFPNDQSKWSEKWHKTAFISFEIAWTSQHVVSVFFWGVLYWVVELPLESLGVALFIYYSHSFGTLMLVIDFIITRIQFRKSDLVYALIPPIAYMILSISLAYAADIIAYPMLTWKDLLSVIVAAILLGMFIGSFYLGEWISRKRRMTADTKNLDKSNEKLLP